MESPQTTTTDSPVSTLLDATIAAFDQGQAASPREGESLIDAWFTTLSNSLDAKPLLEPLTRLRDELQQGTPTNQTLVDSLNDLADRTGQIANAEDVHLNSRLTTLTQALRNFSSQLSTAV